MNFKWKWKSTEYQFKKVRVYLTNDEAYKSKKFLRDFGSLPDLHNPQRFNEKIIYRMLFDKNHDYTIHADKLQAKKIVATKIGLQYIVPLIGVYSNFNEIDFNAFPDKFVIKCTHDSESAIIVRNSEEFNLSEIKSKINFCLSRNMYTTTREWHYKNIPPKIICEHLIDIKNNNSSLPFIEVFRVHCFRGNPEYIETDIARNGNEEYVNIFDTEWNMQDVSVGYRIMKDFLPRPVYLNKLLELSALLAERFDYCRIDWLNAGDRFYFSEYTFTPCGGRMKFNPDSFDYIFGSLWDMPDFRKRKNN